MYLALSCLANCSIGLRVASIVGMSFPAAPIYAASSMVLFGVRPRGFAAASVEDQ